MRIFLQTCSMLILVALSSSLAHASQDKASEELEHDKWLKLRFSEQHKNLIPIVAVADMFFACDKAKNSGNVNYQVAELVENMDRNLLAEKLSQCLEDQDMKSDAALNFGLYGCFYQQLKHLSKEDKIEKMRIVTQSIYSLSREERQKSFSRCVTDQAVSYLK
jgi:hypothetical protein